MNGDLLDLCHSISSCKSLRRSETSVPDLGSGGIRRGSVDFGAFGTRSSPGYLQEESKLGR